MGEAKEVVERFWGIQNEGDCTEVNNLFAENAILVDPLFGTLEGKHKIAEFMKKMNEETISSETSFRTTEIAGDNEVTWAQWIAIPPAGELEGCGLHRVKDRLNLLQRLYQCSG